MLSDRMVRAARLEVDLYEEVERDTQATTQALLVVVIVAVATGIGAALAPDARQGVIVPLLGGVIASVIGWLVWSIVTYWIGTAIFHGTATPGELLRTIGFAQAPGVLRVFSFIPVLGGLINLVTFVWMAVAGVIAVRQALDFDTGKAIGTVLLGVLAYLVIFLVIFIPLGLLL